MKKVLLLILLCAYIGLYAQSRSSVKKTVNSTVAHQDFLGISMGGSITSFKQALIKKGYKFDYLSDYPTTYRFTGSFNNKEAVLLVEVTPKSRIVYRVSVMFDYYSRSSASVETIEKEFERMAEVMISKYGTPDEDTRKDWTNRHCLWYKKILKIQNHYKSHLIQGCSLALNI